MEKKPTSTQAGISKQQLKNLNRPYVAEPIKDESRVNELMSIFRTGELDKIKSVLESNDILNFKDSIGQTLIHAMLNNESVNITGRDKLYVIKSLVDKNVSLNSMNQYNQNALHLACQKGYVEIIDYLLKNNCEQNLIDNYGNAPIHYFVDKFIVECKQDDFYKDSNRDSQSTNTRTEKEISSNELKQFKQIKLQSLLMLFELFDGISMGDNKYEAIEDSSLIINSLKNLVKNKTQYELPIIYEIIEKKVSEIYQIYGDFDTSSSDKLEKAKEIIFNSINDIKKIYDYNLDQIQSNSDEIILNQKSQIDLDKKTCVKNIKNKLENIKRNMDFIKIDLSVPINAYNDLLTYTSEIFYLYLFINENYNNTEVISPDNITFQKAYVYIDSSGKPIIYTTSDGIPQLLDNSSTPQEIDSNLKYILEQIENNFIIPNSETYNIFINGVGHINNMQGDIDRVYVSNTPINIDDSNNYFIINKDDKIGLKGIPYCHGLHMFNQGNYYYCYVILKPNNLTNNQFKNALYNNNFDNFQDDPITWINEHTLWTKYNYYYKFSPIRIIITLIKKLIVDNIIGIIESFLGLNDDKLREHMQKFSLLYVIQVSLTITKIINNLVILEKYLHDINIKELMRTNHNIREKFEEMKNGSSPDFINLIDELLNSTIDNNDIFNSASEFLEFFDKKIYSEIITSIYNKLIQSQDIFISILDDINKYQSLFQLEKYNEFIQDYIDNKNQSNEIKFTNTFFNKYLYEFNKNFPKKFKDYKNKYFKIKQSVNLYELGLEKLTDKYLYKDYIQTPFINLEYFIENKDYYKKFYENIVPYTNTFNFNTWYLDVDNFTQMYLLLFDIIDDDNTNNISSENNKMSKKFEYYIKQFGHEQLEFYDNRYIFSRGYNVVREDRMLDDLKGMEENKILCDMDWIGPKSYFDEPKLSVRENLSKIATYCIEDFMEITNIDFKSYLVTANFNEIISLITYLCYKKILDSPEITASFFEEKKSIEFSTGSGSANKPIGLDLSNFSIGDKKNILETLGFRYRNEEIKKKHVFENVKDFVKLIVDQEIFNESVKIISEIKLKVPKKNSPEDGLVETKLPEREIINIDKLLKSIQSSYKNDTKKFLSKEILKISDSTTIELVQINKTFKKSKFNKTNERMLGTKCLNRTKTDELVGLDFNYKILDLNGNTVITRLIDQFNYYGVEKIVKLKPFLITYKNYRQETPLNYLENLMGIIGAGYLEENFIQQIGKYSTALENSIKDKTEFSEIELENSEELVKGILTNSIYLFNEVLWLKLYDYPNGWGLGDKKKLMELLGIEKEELLIDTFDVFDETSNDMTMFIEQEKDNIVSKVSHWIATLQEELAELENKKKEYEIERDSGSTFIDPSDIDKNLDMINKQIDEKKVILEQSKSIDLSLDNNKESETVEKIKEIFIHYKNKLLDLKNTSINWENYNNLVTQLDSDYFRILKILNEKPQINTNKMISNFILGIFGTDIKVRTKEDLETIEKFFRLIFDNLFADYWDLDKYEDSYFNGLNKSMIEILKINVIGIIKIEIINMIGTYISQTVELNNPADSKVSSIKSDDEILKSLETYLYLSLITRLEIKNPSRTNYPNIDNQKKIIVENIGQKLGIILGQIDKNHIEKIIEFGAYISDNIGTNCFDEMRKILFDGKKISIYYRILSVLKG